MGNHIPVDHNQKAEESSEFYDAIRNINKRKVQETEEQAQRRIQQLKDQGEEIKYQDGQS